ncbi:MAG TPA: hypothetical protein VHJ59_01815 [Nitrososphaera sp.]|nr:hypothetical protein [Nitrososphaera sp.]
MQEELLTWIGGKTKQLKIGKNTYTVPIATTVGIYFNADNSTTTGATYTLKGQSASSNYSAAITKSTVGGQSYVNGNGSSILLLSSSFSSDNAVSIFAKVVPPTSATGSSYTYSDPVIASYIGGVDGDLSLGFGAAGVLLYTERDRTQKTIATNDYATVIGLTNPIVVSTYVPLLPEENTYLLGESINGIQSFIPAQNTSGVVRLQGILGAVSGGKLGHGAKLRSVLVLEGKMTAAQVNAIASTFASD